MSNSRWLIAVPYEAKEHESREELRRSLNRIADVYPVVLPQHVLKVGTLDSLVGISDELVKLDENVNGLIKRVERTYNDVFKHGADYTKNDSKTLER